jgi:hydrogenase maturation protein HypF
MTSQLAGMISQETGIEIKKTQHHHAHIVSVCAENSINPDENVVGIALDGAGYGPDGAIWGGEVLISNFFDYKRVGRLEYLPIPGGDLCTLYPYRMLISALSTTIGEDELRDITDNHIKEALPNGFEERDLIIKQSKTRNVLKTSSAGRFLDSVASLLGLTYYRTYEGEPAMRLESLAEKGNPNTIKYRIEIEKKNGIYEIKTANMLKYLIDNRNNHKKDDIAAFTQKYLAQGISSIAIDVADAEQIGTVALSGGVLVNRYITQRIMKNIEDSGLKVLTNIKIPLGDGGSSLGQSCIALASVI